MEFTERKIQQMKIDIFPIGRENKKNMQQLMYEAKIFDKNQFKKELAELKKEHIIFSVRDGYYIPNTVEEINGFILQVNNKNKENTKKINLAYKMLEENRK